MGRIFQRHKYCFGRKESLNKHKPTIVFVHFLEGSHKDFICNQAVFSREYFTVSFDLRGSGDSSKTLAAPAPGATFNYTNQALAYDMHTLLKNLGVTGPLIFVGAVSGGYVILKYLELYNNPESPLFDKCRLASKLIFISSGPGLNTVPDCAFSNPCNQDGVTCCIQPTSCQPCDTGTKVILSAPGANCCICWPFGTSTCTGLQGLVPFLTFDFPGAACVFAEGAFAETCNAQVKLAREAFVQDFLKSNPNVFISLFFNAFAEDLRGVVKTIKIPTLITYGELPPVPAGNSFFLHDNIQGSNLVAFVNQGEVPNLTDWITWNKLALKFIKGCPLPDTLTINEPCCVCPCYVPTGPVPCTFPGDAQEFFKKLKAVKKSA